MTMRTTKEHSDMTLAVRGLTDSAEIRALLLNVGVQSFRKLAGFIPDVMSLADEPKPIMKDWRTGIHHSHFSQYQLQWVIDALGLDPFSEEPGGWTWRIPWSIRR